MAYSASEASGNFFEVYLRERNEQKNFKVPSCHLGGNPQVMDSESLAPPPPVA